MRTACILAAFAAALANAMPAFAAPGDPVEVSDTLTIDPIIDTRLRYEAVDQDTVNRHAEAVTMRLRAGAEFTLPHLSLLVEGEGTLGIANEYNAFPFAVPSLQRRTAYAVVADPMNVELNRLQLQYKGGGVTVTTGRQRINLDDQRWVGSVGWRQNEQTFDAVRGETKLGPVMVDGTYSWSQRTIFAVDAGPRQAYPGTFAFAGGGAKAGPVNLKAFAYLLDYREAFFAANSSQTYGLRATTSLPMTPSSKLDLAASYARQSDWKASPLNYAADYVSVDAAFSHEGLGIVAGWEKLGSDNGRAVQTPMATLHKFNGWADVFLTTPPAGLQDLWFGAAYKFAGVKALRGLNAAVTWHRFDSDAGSVEYGNEWDASVGAKVGRVGVLAKYADYTASGFGTDTRKFWLQLELAY